MDKKERKRDIAVFANILKDLMNDEVQGDHLTTLDRDLQHFIYGRVAVMVKHNEGKPIGSVADISAVVGAAFASILGEILGDKVNDADTLQKLVLSARENLIDGFQSRAPVLKTPASAEEPKIEETT
jgi:hypothetical protein